MRLSIPQPCHEDWQKMSPEAQGRFCSLCSKTVVDFTAMTDSEVMAYFENHYGQKTCGRFKSNQLDIIKIKIPQQVFRQRLPYLQKFLLALLVSFSALFTSCERPHAVKTVMQIEMADELTGIVRMEEAVTDSPPPQQSKPTEIIIPDDEIMGDIAIMETPEIYPEFVGGDSALKAYITTRLKTLKLDEWKDSLPRRVFVDFTVDTSGQVANPKIIKGGLDETNNKIILTAFKEMPRWKPGMLNDKPRNFKVRYPLKLKN